MEEKQFRIVDTTATKKIFELRKRIRAVAGGTAGSKTVSILIWLIDYCQQNHPTTKLCSIVSESYPHLVGGAMEDFQLIMKDRGYWDDNCWVKSPRSTYTFSNGNRIEFLSVDTYGKAHGPRRDILFLNECNNLAYSIADQLITRTREIVWMDWNPTVEFWFYTEMLSTRTDVDFITLTYKDNEGLDEATIKEIESHKHNERWWNVYGLGLLGEARGRIYTGWKIIDKIPHEARLARRGLDFGYSIDPTVIEDIYEYNGGFIIDEILYRKGMSNKSIADFLNAQEEEVLTVADSAEPKSIQEIADHGVMIIGAQKGPGSVNRGIDFVQDQKISVTKRSLKTIKAYRNYIWKIDKKTDKELLVPDDAIHEWSNPMDAIRYGLSSFGKKDTQQAEVDDAISDLLGNKDPLEFEALGYEKAEDFESIEF